MQPGDDLSSHFAEASTLASRLRGGDLDFWFSETQLGYPLFMTYTPLPTMLIGAALCFAKDRESPSTGILIYSFRLVEHGVHSTPGIGTTSGGRHIYWSRGLIAPPFLPSRVIPVVDSELQIFKYCIAVIWMVSPAAWYVGSRGMGLSRLQASFAAVRENPSVDPPPPLHVQSRPQARPFPTISSQCGTTVQTSKGSELESTPSWERAF